MLRTQVEEEMTFSHKSILENALIRQNTLSQLRAVDQPQLGRLDFYPAGYTKNNRQASYFKLYAHVQGENKLSEKFPLGRETHRIAFVHERKNKHDVNAIRIWLVLTSQQLIRNINDDNGTTLDLGYVPAVLAKDLVKKLPIIQHGLIYKVVKWWDDKFYIAKISLFYENQHELALGYDPTLVRFRDLG